MTPRVVSGAARGGWIRRTFTRFPLLSTAVIGFLLGFAGVAAFLLPGVMQRSEAAVPNVVGLLYADAAARLSAAGFVAKTGESLNHQTAPKTSVLGQNPAPGVKALKGDEIILDVSLGARRAAVPDIIGLSREDAFRALEKSGFDLPTDIVERLSPRARGEVLVDMLQLLQRTGFDEAQLRGDQSQEAGKRALAFFAEGYYQGDVHEQRPSFAR